MEIIEKIYIWNNFKTAIEYPELILEGVFEGLPKEWRDLKRLIRKSQFDEAYLIIENDSVDISWSLRYATARFGLVFMGISKIRRKQRGRIIILAMNNGLCGNIRYMESI